MNVKLRAARERAGKTQAEVARVVGIREAVYQRYEYGVNEPSVQTAIRIADALHSSVESLFRREKEGSSDLPTR